MYVTPTKCLAVGSRISSCIEFDQISLARIVNRRQFQWLDTKELSVPYTEVAFDISWWIRSKICALNHILKVSLSEIAALLRRRDYLQTVTSPTVIKWCAPLNIRRGLTLPYVTSSLAKRRFFCQTLNTVKNIKSNMRRQGIDYHTVRMVYLRGKELLYKCDGSTDIYLGDYYNCVLWYTVFRWVIRKTVSLKTLTQ